MNLMQKYLEEPYVFKRNKVSGAWEKNICSNMEPSVVADPMREIALIMGAIALISKETVIRTLNAYSDSYIDAWRVMAIASAEFAKLPETDGSHRLSDAVAYILMEADLLDLPKAIDVIASAEEDCGLYAGFPALFNPDDPLDVERFRQFERIKSYLQLQATQGEQHGNNGNSSKDILRPEFCVRSRSCHC